jgi:ribosomal protein S18 acetylase RimI-like enzyme
MTTTPADQPDPFPQAIGSGLPDEKPLETDPTPHPTPHPRPRPVATRVPIQLATQAAARIVTVPPSERSDAGRRLISQGGSVGLRSDMMWGVRGTQRHCPFRQVTLIVPSSGRTAVTFLSDPVPPHRAAADALGDDDQQLAERVACLQAASDELTRTMGDAFVMLQALPDPADTWAISAFRAADWLEVGALSYLQRPLFLPEIDTVPANDRASDRESKADPRTPDLPPGVTLHPINHPHPGGVDFQPLVRAMERSYIDTLDCPALCGIRPSADVLDSHLSAGRWTPTGWTLVLADGEPEGCVLLTRTMDQDSVELVYLGLGPRLRGLGLGKTLLRYGIARIQDEARGNGAYRGVKTLTCAVDQRNAPALNVYHALGYAEHAVRVAFVYVLNA